MMQKVFHPGNPFMRYVRAIAINLWRLSVLITLPWGVFYLGYESAFLLLVGLPWIAWLIVEKLNGGPINHNSARNLLTRPLTWLILFCSIYGMVKLAFSLNFWIAFFPLFLAIFAGLFVVTKTDFLSPGCFACFKNTPLESLKSCPECSLEFAGGGWTGFKRHWESHHQDIESYENVWGNMCAAHKKKGIPKK